jgi:hypothetical protein
MLRAAKAINESTAEPTCTELAELVGVRSRLDRVRGICEGIAINLEETQMACARAHGVVLMTESQADHWASLLRQEFVVERQSPESELPVLARVVRDDGSSVTIYDGPNSPPSE